LTESEGRSDDEGKSWEGAVYVTYQDELFLCEGSIVQLDSGALVCYMRENQGKGYSRWVTIPDGDFFAVNYICDDAPMAHIRSYCFNGRDF